MSRSASETSGAIEDGFSETGRRMLRMVEKMECRFGLERSVKIGDGSVNRDRFLVTLHKNSFGPDEAHKFPDFARHLGIGESALNYLLQRLPDADIIHFGHEGGIDPVAKIYLEFARSVMHARTVSHPVQVLVHLACKWPVAAPELATFTHYTWPVDARGTNAISSRLSKLEQATHAARFASTILELARQRCADEELLFMDVEEEGTLRRSFDLNFYPSRLTVGDTASDLEQLCRAYGLSKACVDRLIEQSGTAVLGHVSGGRDRTEKDFTTLYYGVEAREGRAGG